MDNDEEFELVERLVAALERIADSLEHISQSQAKVEKRTRKKTSP